MSDLDALLQQLTRVFDQKQIVYAVMGGMAVRVFGIARPTYDVDFTVGLARDRLTDLFETLEDMGCTMPEAYHAGWIDQIASMPLIKAKFFVEGLGIDIDLFLAETPFQQAVLNRRRLEQVDSFHVWMVSPEDLILLKLIARRPRDLADIGDVLFMQGSLDEAYLRSWAQRLGVLQELELALRDTL